VTAIAKKRRRTTVVGVIGTLVLVLAAAAMFAVGVVTLSNSEEGEAVGVDLRPTVALPATPNALVAVADEDGGLESAVVLTLLPDNVGGSIVIVPRNADVTAAFGAQRRPLNEVFAADAGDMAAFESSVEEMLSITIERSEVVSADDLASVFGDGVTDVPTIAQNTPIDDAFWSDLAAAAPLDAEPVSVPLDEFDQPIPPATVGELAHRLLSGEVQERALATRVPSEGENPTGADVVIVDRQDANLVFAQVSPALVSTPNTGLSVRIVAPFSDDQIEASDGKYESTTELMLDVISQMYFFQANVVSVDTQPGEGGASEVTVIQVAEERFVEDMEAIAPIVFGDSEVVLASTLIEGIDVVVTLGTDYISTQSESSSKPESDETGGADTVAGTVAVTSGDTVGGDD
jgi:hypothetical protein